MKTEYTSIESLQALPIVVSYVGEVVKTDWGTKPQTVDQWRVEFRNASGFHSFDYFTGLGLRKKHKLSGHVAPVKPTNADVMYSLTLDADAANLNFDDWCSECGLSSDSIKALHTYQTCLETARVLNKYLGRETVQQVREILQDY